jgi:hypothetical protein
MSVEVKSRNELFAWKVMLALLDTTAIRWQGSLQA